MALVLRITKSQMFGSNSKYSRNYFREVFAISVKNIKNVHLLNSVPHLNHRTQKIIRVIVFTGPPRAVVTVPLRVEGLGLGS